MTARIIWIGKNRDIPTFSDRAVSSSLAARNLASPLGEAPSFDATAERWVTLPSGMKPDASAAVDLQHPERKRTLSFRPLKSYRPAADPPRAAGHLLSDIVTAALGLLVFGLVAAAFLVLA